MFKTQAGRDIGFAVIGGEPDAAAVMAASDRPPLLRIRRGEDTQRGNVELPAGWAQVEFSNEYSFWRAKQLGYSLVCTPFERKRQRDEALVSLRELAVGYDERQEVAIRLTHKLRALDGRIEDARQLLQRRKTQEQALRELRLEFGSGPTDGAHTGETEPLVTAVAAAVSKAEVDLHSWVSERNAVAARYEAEVPERKVSLQQMEEILTGIAEVALAQA